ncbi:DUF1819 family protein [Syntrophomonas wolfei]|uniref:DUF1819 domain-containing protein n=1 Tax=Syntrophomonas wolfei subsp. wolfei (strain DSM 2245B / Goettingen) TaxID=335541 RepID=Q0AU19_SYNWW|nr:DUF1819 family protein [Syntrophomonas wolfei]ABI69785.1 conserved hypothetical protein [Syntrophomonas wolfei subsp. wolfei str. Goettingen G311]
MTEIKYSAALTGEPFLFYESRQVARLKLSGRNQQQIREEIKSQNLFQYATEKSLAKRINAVQKRVDTLDETLLRFLAEKPSATAKIINLYAIMQTNKLMLDFIIEIIGDKFEQGNLVLEKRDLNEFFVAKREQQENIARWSDETIAKLKRVLPRIIFEAGILADRNTGTLQRLTLDKDVEKYFREHGEIEFLKAVGTIV